MQWWCLEAAASIYRLHSGVYGFQMTKLTGRPSPNIGGKRGGTGYIPYRYYMPQKDQLWSGTAIFLVQRESTLGDVSLKSTLSLTLTAFLAKLCEGGLK